MSTDPGLGGFTLPRPGAVDRSNAQDKLVEQLAAVVVLNERIRQSPIDESLPEKLKKWIDDLLDYLRVIVASLPEAESFAVSAGPPAGISITVTFRP